MVRRGAFRTVALFTLGGMTAGGAVGAVLGGVESLEYRRDAHSFRTCATAIEQEQTYILLSCEELFRDHKTIGDYSREDDEYPDALRILARGSEDLADQKDRSIGGALGGAAIVGVVSGALRLRYISDPLVQLT